MMDPKEEGLCQTLVPRKVMEEWRKLFKEKKQKDAEIRLNQTLEAIEKVHDIFVD